MSSGHNPDWQWKPSKEVQDAIKRGNDKVRNFQRAPKNEKRK